MEFTIGFVLGWFLSVPVYLFWERQRVKDPLRQSFMNKGGRNPHPPKDAKRPPQPPPAQGVPTKR